MGKNCSRRRENENGGKREISKKLNAFEWNRWFVVNRNEKLWQIDFHFSILRSRENRKGPKSIFILPPTSNYVGNNWSGRMLWEVMSSRNDFLQVEGFRAFSEVLWQLWVLWSRKPSLSLDEWSTPANFILIQFFLRYISSACRVYDFLVPETPSGQTDRNKYRASRIKLCLAALALTTFENWSGRRF